MLYEYSPRNFPLKIRESELFATGTKSWMEQHSNLPSTSYATQGVAKRHTGQENMSRSSACCWTMEQVAFRLVKWCMYWKKEPQATKLVKVAQDAQSTHEADDEIIRR
jgi:hypothetical protein